MATSFSTIKYIVTYRANKNDPQATQEFNTAEAAYHFALSIESGGGITIVTPVNQPVLQKPTLRFDEEN